MLGLFLAATFYVAPNGNNANPGTLNAPFATITRGVSALDAGDRLLVRGGTYRESVRVVNKREIQIRNYPGEKPVIDGTGTTANGLVIVTLSSSVRLEGFEIRNGPKSGVLLYDVQDVMVRGNDVHHHFRFGIHAVSDEDKPRGTTRRVVIANNKVHHNVQQNASGKAREWMQGIGTFRARSVDIRGNEVYENFGEGIDAVMSDDVTIAQNTVWDNFSANIYLDNASNAHVDGNRVASGRAKHPRLYYRDGQPAPAIFAANETYGEQNPLRDLSITSNVTSGGKYGFGYGDYERGGGLHRVRVANNTFRGATDRVLYIEPAAHDDTLIENNIFEAERGREYAYAPAGKITYRRNCWRGGKAGTEKRGEGDSCGAGIGAAREMDQKRTPREKR
ncbi:MAG: right-handed parallel beta-helix repeat-containing protein [Thermoanaerobaculia bacterium]